MSFWSELTGTKPKVPPLATLHLDDMAAEAAKANAANEPAAAAAAKLTEGDIMAMLKEVVPNLDEIQGTASKNIASMLKGELPKDVQTMIESSAAAQAAGEGVQGSGFARNITARDLGLNSLALMEKGISSAESWLSSSERMISPAVAELSSMFITPMQEYATTNEQNLQQFQRDWMKQQIGSMPDPVTKGITDTFVGAFMQGAGRGGSSFISPTQKYGDGGGSLSWDTGSKDMMDAGFNYGQDLGTDVNIDFGGGAGIDNAIEWGLTGA